MYDGSSVSMIPVRQWDFDRFYKMRRETMTDHFRSAGKVWDDKIEIENHKRVFSPATTRIIRSYNECDGFVNVVVNEEGVRISHLCIERSLQGKGIGTLVMQTLMREFKDQRISLDVLVGNPAAALYERLGFRPTMGDNPLLRYYQVTPKLM